MSSTEADRAALANRHRKAWHVNGYDYCHEDGQTWPCDTVRALALPPDPERLALAIAHSGIHIDKPRTRDGRETRCESCAPAIAAIVAAWEAINEHKNI